MSSRSGWRRGLAVCVLAALLVGCGGSGGSGGGNGGGGAAATAIDLYAGSLQRAGTSDGVGAAAQFNLPAGVAQ
ncbi:MAG TPA: hypothetical protein VNN06_11825, partial [Ramlibacter sp.]|nr:hypothetical protein [Ramlibacter sp.]